MLGVQLGGMLLGAVALVYLLGFEAHPHRIGSACLFAACYVAVTGIVMLLTQKAWRAQARNAATDAARRATAEMTESAGLDAPGGRHYPRSQRRIWLSVTLLGAAMLIAFLVLVVHYEGSAQTLESSGVHVEGVVTNVVGQQEAPFDGAVDVQYVYAGQSFNAHIYRDDNSPFYHVGEAVTVSLDPSDPQVATIGGSDNMRPGLVVLLVVLLLGGGFALFIGLWMLIVPRLARRKTRSTTVQADHPA
jgi:hypothetical protein